jgi:proteasome accessory factor A
MTFLARDCELSTSGWSASGGAAAASAAIAPFEAARAVLGGLEAAGSRLGFKVWTRDGPRRSDSGRWRSGFDSGSGSSIDCLRHWTSNGQCFYSDMGHLELCTAAASSPRAFAAQALAALRIVEAARAAAESEAEPGTRYSLSAANLDLVDPASSWGSHLNAGVPRDLWQELCGEGRHPSTLSFVAGALAAAIPFFGAGCLLPFNDGSVIFSLSARAHHLSKIRSSSTTEAFRRGLINTRDEPHGEGCARLHLIGFDFNLLSAALLGSFLQCLFAAAARGECAIGLYDPVRAARAWSWSLDLERGVIVAGAALADGSAATLPAFLRRLAARFLELVEDGSIGPGEAPEAGELLPRIIELTHRLEAGELEALSRHLDWAAKLRCLLHLAREPGGRLGDVRTRLSDHDFANTDPRQGMLWDLHARGLVDFLTDEALARSFVAEGPPESRDWGRGRLIERFGERIVDLDWSGVEFSVDGSRWGRRLRLDLPRLDGFSKRECEAAFDAHERLDDLLAALARQRTASAVDSDPLLDIETRLARAGDLESPAPPAAAAPAQPDPLGDQHGSESTIAS